MSKIRGRTTALSFSWSGVTLVAFAVLLVWTLFPIYWTLASGLKSGAQLYTHPPTYFPIPPTLANFQQVFVTRALLKFMRNSLIVAAISTPLSVFVGALAAYSLARFRFRGRGLLMFLVLAVRMLPALIIALPMFLIFTRIGLVDNLFALAIVYVAFNLPFNIWLLAGFFAEVPKELEEAAVVDGCSRWQAFVKVLVPLTAPGLVAAAILSAIFSWNEFAYALILTNTPDAQTLPIAMAGLQTDRGTAFGEIGAIGTVAVLPVLAFGLYVQKYLARGLTAGAVKG